MVEGALGGEMVLTYLLSKTLSWPTAGVGRSLELTKDSGKKIEEKHIDPMFWT